MNQRISLPLLANLPFVEDLYGEFLRDPASVSPAWRDYFKDVENDGDHFMVRRRGPSRPPKSLFDPERDRNNLTPPLARRDAPFPDLTRSPQAPWHPSAPSLPRQAPLPKDALFARDHDEI